MQNIINKALLFSIEAHNKQVRKDGKPYICHPITVGLILSKNGASDDLICAGLLHDTIEDTDITKDQILEEFGETICQLVLFDTEDKTKSWDERKKYTIKKLENASVECAMLICADKLSNTYDLKDLIKNVGDDVWTYFKFGKKKQKWLYYEFLRVLKPISNLKMYQELENNIKTIFGENEICEEKIK